MAFQLLLAMITIYRATLAMSLRKAYCSNTDTPNLGADGKDYRADSVHAPFPEHLSTPSNHPITLEVRGFPACEQSPAM
jgi:hypothetical protein